MSLSDLLGLSVEERPLVVGSTPHSSRVVMGERMQIVTVFPSAAETTLSSSPTTAPRISTSSSNVTGGDVCRVIQQDTAPSPNRVLAGSVVRRGTARRPAKQSTGRGQGLASMLVDNARGAGRGQVTTPLTTRREVRTREKTDRHSYRARTSSSGHDAAGLSGSCGYLLRGHLQATLESWNPHL